MGVCGTQVSQFRVKPYTCGCQVEDGFRLTRFCILCEKIKKDLLVNFASELSQHLFSSDNLTR